MQHFVVDFVLLNAPVVFKHFSSMVQIEKLSSQLSLLSSLDVMDSLDRLLTNLSVCEAV